MGAAASTRGSKGGDVEMILALDQAHKGMRLFQHKVSGEIIVLYNEDMVSYLGEKARGQYDEAVLSQDQSDYFKRIKIKLAAPVKNVDFVGAPPTPSDRGSNVELSSPGAAANDQDGLRKRLSNLRVAASDKDHTNGEVIAGLSASHLASHAEPKQGHGDTHYESGAKVKNGNQRRFVSQPYFPPSAYQQDRRLAEELHSQSFSEMPLGGDAKESPLRQEKGEEDDKFSPTVNSMKSSRCKHCNEVFFGRTSEEALEDHNAMCALHTDVRKQLETPDNMLRNALLEFTAYKSEDMQAVVASALAHAAEELDQANPLFKRVQALAFRALQVQVNSANNKYIHRLRSTIDVDLKTMQATLKGLHGDPRCQAQVHRLESCCATLQNAQTQLHEKQIILRRHRLAQTTAKDFNFLRVLGKGGFASVYLARRKESRKLCAVKVLNKEVVRNAGCQAQVQRERLAMTIASHYPDYFVRFLSSFQSRQHLFIVMEYVPGGDCMTLINSLQHVPEVVAQHFIAQVCLGVRHLHRHGVVHRDIKPDNILITAMGHAKIGDFGLMAPYTRVPSSPIAQVSSVHAARSIAAAAPTNTINNMPDHRSWLEEESSGLFAVAPAKTAGARTDIPKSGSMFQDVWEATSDSSLFQPLSFDDHNPHRHPNAAAQDDTPNPRRMLRSLVGNYNYSCPEIILRKGYDHSVDWWAVAVLCFHFLAGSTPFESENKEQTMDNIVSGAVNWAALPKQTSDECKHFIASVITFLQPERRLGYHSSDEVLCHPFFRDIDFATLYHGYGPVHPHLRSSTKHGRLSHSSSQSQSFSASFVEPDGLDDDIDIFTSVNSEQEASDLAQLIATECSADPQQEKAVDELSDFVDFDCLYA